MAETRNETAPLQWRAWPLVEYPGRTALALATVAAAAAAIYFLWHAAWLAGVGGAALLLSLQGHLLPRRYELDAEGVTVTVLGLRKHRPWDHFHSYYADRLGVMLSTFTYPSRLDSFRGMNLRFGRENREAVSAFVAAQLPRAEKRRRGAS